MEVKYRETFLKDNKKKVEQVIQRVLLAKELSEIPNLKMMKGSKKQAYRIRIGDYRIGFYLLNQTVEFARILARKAIYKKLSVKVIKIKIRGI